MTERFLHTLAEIPGFDETVALSTRKLSDESFVGTWSRIPKPMVTFADHNMGGRSMTHHGGPIAGASGGTPVQLVFWGQWWTGPGAATRAAIEAQAQRLLASRYFAELAQYGIGTSPFWRGSITVTHPAAPASGTASQAIRATLDLIDDLIDDDVFPDPDDGPRIAFIVVMPAGFTVSDAMGSHWHDYDFDGPFDTDTYWAGWARLADPVGTPPNETVVTIGHEIAEIITDPEGDAWHTEDTRAPNEIVDAGQSPSAGARPFDLNARDQTAFTDNVKLQAYWSNAHRRTVIPLNEGYMARLRATIRETARHPLHSGTFTPKPGALRVCVGERDVWWRTSMIDERIKVRFDGSGFHTPVAGDWSINGHRLTGSSGSFVLHVTARGHSGIDSVDLASAPEVRYGVVGGGLDITVTGSAGGFSLVVGCSVKDTAITGNVFSQPIARPTVEVGVRGVELEVDPEYTEAVSRCLKAFLKPYLEQHLPTNHPRPGDPPVFDVAVIRQLQVAATSQHEWQRAREIATGITAAYAMLDRDAAREYAMGLLQALPSVNGRLSIEDVEQGFLRAPRAGDRTSS